MAAGVCVLEVAAPPGGGTTTLLEGPAPPAGGLDPSFDLVMCDPSPGARTAHSRTAARILSATRPLLARNGTGRSAPNEPIAVAIFFLGAMAMKTR